MCSARSTRLISLPVLLSLSACVSSRPDQTSNNSIRKEPARQQTVSLLGRTLFATPPTADIAKLEANLATARIELEADPDNPDKMVCR